MDIIKAEVLYSIDSVSERPVRSVSIEQRGNYMASLSLDGTVRLYDLSVVRRGKGAPVKLRRSMPHALRDLEGSLGGASSSRGARVGLGASEMKASEKRGAGPRVRARGCGVRSKGADEDSQNGGDDSNTVRSVWSPRSHYQ